MAPLSPLWVSPGFLSLPALSSNWRPLTAAVAHTLSAPFPDTLALRLPPASPKKGSTHRLTSDQNLLLLHPPFFLRMKLFLESKNLEVETSPAPRSTQSTTPTGETFSGSCFCVKLSHILTALKTKSTREPSPPSFFFLNKLKKAFFNPQKAD